MLENDSGDEDDTVLRDMVSFDNAKAWREQMLQIPYGIPNDTWHAIPFIIDSLVTEVQKNKYSFKYRNVLDVIIFFLGQELNCQ